MAASPATAQAVTPASLLRGKVLSASWIAGATSLCGTRQGKRAGGSQAELQPVRFLRSGNF
jgi:hypothetical protein